MNETINAVKRFIVVLYTELLLFIIGIGTLYILYIKNCTMQDILNLILNPLNPLTLVILGIGSIGGGYIGVKAWENVNNKTASDNTLKGGQTNDGKN